MLEQLSGSGRRFAAVSVVAVAVIATAVSVTIWRYEAALSRSSVALDARSDAALTATLSSDFWHEHEAINEYFLAPSPAILAAVSAQRRQFAATSAVLGATQNAAETRFREQATSANNAFIATLTRLKGAAGTTSARELAAIAQLRANEASVLRPLTELDHAQAQRAQTAQAAAVSAASQARWIGVAAAILAVLTGARPQGGSAARGGSPARGGTVARSAAGRGPERCGPG